MPDTAARWQCSRSWWWSDLAARWQCDPILWFLSSTARWQCDPTCDSYLPPQDGSVILPGDEQICHAVVACAELLPGDGGTELEGGDNAVHLGQSQRLWQWARFGMVWTRDDESVSSNLEPCTLMIEQEKEYTISKPNIPEERQGRRKTSPPPCQRQCWWRTCKSRLMTIFCKKNLKLLQRLNLMDFSNDKTLIICRIRTWTATNSDYKTVS